MMATMINSRVADSTTENAEKYFEAVEAVAVKINARCGNWDPYYGDVCEIAEMWNVHVALVEEDIESFLANMI